jgi:glutaredoxin
MRLWRRFLRFLRLARPAARCRPTLMFCTRQGCHLCEDVQRMLRELAADYDFEVEVRDVDDDSELAVAYGDKVPVIVHANRARLWGRIKLVMLRRLLDGLGARR